jgi:hypothetical protein
VKRIIIASVMAMTVVAAVLAASTTAGASGPGAVITFSATGATLQIPDPPCPATEPNCVWKFFLNEPKVSVDVATVYGTSGTLTIDYPLNFCGIIQADAYIGPTANGPWTPQRGWQHPVTGDCTPDTTTTTTTVTPPATVPPDGPSQGVVTPTTVPAPAPVPETQAAAVTPTTTVPAMKDGATVTTLPFTGVNIMPFILAGVTCVALGLGLLVGRRKDSL